MAHCIYCMKQIADGARFCPFCGRDQSVQPSQHHLKPGTVLRERYLVGAALGEGGFGITYVGLDTALDLRVAIKEFYPFGYVTRIGTVSENVSELTDEAKAAFFTQGKKRFMQEARVLAKFSGTRGIVDVRDFFEENNTAYIVMEFVDGVTLKQHLKDHGTLSPEETLHLLTPVMESLRLLHKENVIHRDISPDNIMLTNGEVKLLDFGAARSVDGDNKSLSVMLKPGYAPEEQYRSKGKQGPWTDVYALSATMYRCITGIRPDESPDRIWDDSLQPPSALGVAIDPQFEKALLKGLAVKAEDRWQTVDDLLAALTRPQKQTPPKSPPPPPRRPDATQTAFAPEIPAQRNPTPPPVSASDINKNTEEPTNKSKRGLKIALAGAAMLAIGLIIAIVIRGAQTGNGSEVGEIYTFGDYQGEEIEWQILDRDGNKALLISKYALDCKPYHTEHIDVTWETCSLRAWLNDDFYNAAFSDSEKSRIQSTTVAAEDNTEHDTDAGNDTTDKVFLLSIDEANTYFKSYDARKCAPTDYATAQGAYTSSSYTTSDGKATCWWWLRSPGDSTSIAARVDYNGSVDSYGFSVYNYLGAVRPALWINLAS